MSSSSCHIGFAVDFIASSSACSQREQEKGEEIKKRNHVLNTMSAIIGKCKRKQKREHNSTISPIVACDINSTFSKHSLRNARHTDSSENVLNFLLLFAVKNK